MLAALSLLGLGIFGPGIANGLVSGGPQLGAGAAVGTGRSGRWRRRGRMAGAGMAAGGLAAAGGVAAGAARGSAALAGGATAAYRAGGASGVATSGLAQGRRGRDEPAARVPPAASRTASRRRTGRATGERRAIGGRATPHAACRIVSATAPPAWAQPHEARARPSAMATSAAAHAVRSGDSGGGGSSVNLSEGE